MSLRAVLREALVPVYRKDRLMLLCKELKAETGPGSPRRLEVVAIGPEHRDQLEQFIREHHRDVPLSLRMINTWAKGTDVDQPRNLAKLVTVE